MAHWKLLLEPKLVCTRPPPPPTRPALAGAVLAGSVLLPALEVARPEAPPGVLEKVPPFPPVGTEVRDCRRTLLPAQVIKLSYTDAEEVWCAGPSVLQKN